MYRNDNYEMKKRNVVTKIEIELLGCSLDELYELEQDIMDLTYDFMDENDRLVKRAKRRYEEVMAYGG